MKKIFLLVFVGLAGLSSCSTKCPAYSHVKPATHTSTTITASAAPTSDSARQ